MRRDRIQIVPYDAGWPAAFEEQRAALPGVLGPWLRHPVAHIGSTAVPGLPAKPIIDMVAVVEDRGDFGHAIPLIGEVGWRHAPEPADEQLRRWSLCFPEIESRSHHLHVVEHRSAGWRDWQLFRDYLRSHSTRVAGVRRRASTPPPGRAARRRPARRARHR